MRNVLRLATMFGLLLGAGLFAASCVVGLGGGGGDALTLEEFFAEVEALDNKFESEVADVEAGFGELDESSSVEDAVDLLEQEVDVVEGFVDSLDGLEAPDEAADIHEEAVSAGRAVVQAFRDAIDESSDAESVEDFFSPFEAGELDPVFERFDQACLDAEALAAENNITVDLNCGE